MVTLLHKRKALKCGAVVFRNTGPLGEDARARKCPFCDQEASLHAWKPSQMVGEQQLLWTRTQPDGTLAFMWDDWYGQ